MQRNLYISQCHLSFGCIYINISHVDQLIALFLLPSRTAAAVFFLTQFSDFQQDKP